MSLLADAISGLGSALLPLAAVLLLEELTYGGLVRLLLRPKPVSPRTRCSGTEIWLEESKRNESYHEEGVEKCSR